MTKTSGLKIVCIQIVILFCLLEVALRLFFVFPEISNFNRVDYTLTAYFGGILDLTGARQRAGSTEIPKAVPIRNAKLVWISDPDNVYAPIDLNLYGFRGDGFKIKKDPAVSRIVILGDSFAEGFGVQNEEVYSELLKKELSKAHKVEIINFGVGGIGFPEYLRLASDILPIINPDIVILNTCYNDFPTAELVNKPAAFSPIVYPSYIPRVYVAVKELLASRPPTTSQIKGPYPFFRGVPDKSNPLTDINLEGVVSPKILEAMRAGRANPFNINAASANEGGRLTKGISHAKEYLLAIKNLSDSVGAKFLVTYTPLHVTVSDRYYSMWNELGEDFSAPTLKTESFRSQQRELKAYLQTIGVPFIDQTPMLEAKESQGRQMFIGYDEHLNSAGHQAVADLLADKVEELLYSSFQKSLP